MRATCRASAHAALAIGAQCKRLGVTCVTPLVCLQVLLKYNMQRGVPVLAKASSPAHLAENLTGMFDWKLTNDQKATLDALDAGVR